MSYPAVEVKAWYDTRTDTIEIGQTYINTILKSISEDKLDSRGKYIKPKENIISDIQSYFTDIVDRHKVKEEAETMNPDKYGGIREFDVVVGIVYLNDNGEIDHFGHFDSYNAIGPSQRRIIKVFSKKIVII